MCANAPRTPTLLASKIMRIACSCTLARISDELKNTNVRNSTIDVSCRARARRTADDGSHAGNNTSVVLVGTFEIFVADSSSFGLSLSYWSIFTNPLTCTVVCRPDFSWRRVVGLGLGRLSPEPSQNPPKTAPRSSALESTWLVQDDSIPVAHSIVHVFP